MHRYPVKSMAGERLESAQIGPGGLDADRQWALRDIATGNLVSAKRPARWGRLLECRSWYEAGQPMVELPMGDRYEVGSDEASSALSDLLGRAVEFERFERPAQGQYEADWPDVEGLVWAGQTKGGYDVNIAGAQSVGFVDVFPLHLVTTVSMAALGEASPDLMVDARRFRPTMVNAAP